MLLFSYYDKGAARALRGELGAMYRLTGRLALKFKL
ncbi:MAG: hypothetical protein ACI906_003762 [Candidatus Latescibacterota bacterium]|jgi:hypothetical protein